MAFFLLLALLLAALGLVMLLRARAGRQAAGLPAGRVTYADTGAWSRCERPLFSRRYRLTGRPDYLVRVGRRLVPVEVKSGPAPARPHAGHVLQLGAYCLLVEEQEGRAPPHGILKYADHALEVDYTPALRTAVLAAAESVRHDLHAREVGRSHDDADRCRACGYRHACDERLA